MYFLILIIRVVTFVRVKMDTLVMVLSVLILTNAKMTATTAATMPAA